MVGIEVEIGITLNAMIGVGVIKTVEVMEIKIAQQLIELPFLPSYLIMIVYLQYPGLIYQL
jgi:hypothetical protein